MTTEPTASGGGRNSYERVLGRLAGPRRGPTVLVTAGLHGNEPAGLAAGRRVLDRICETGGLAAGDLVVVAGNLRALDENIRFVDRDLNREWNPETVSALLLRQHTAEAAEYREMLAVLETLQEAAAGARGPIHFLDLHTSSADGPPFVTIGDTLRNRRFALQIPLPLILGLEEQVDGALLEFLNNFGFITMGVEGGHHAAESSVNHHAAVLWLALGVTGLVDPRREECRRARRLLSDAARGKPQVLEIRHRRAVRNGDGFRMLPGYANFQPIERGELLATDHSGEVRSPLDGMILLPLYQGKGDDGFFVGRQVRPFWLKVSAVLRRARLAALMPLLPGVRAHPERPEVLMVDTRVARWFPLEIFHLLGYRKLRRNGEGLFVSRRRYDLSAPREISLATDRCGQPT